MSSLLSTTISNLFNGVSQQPAELRDSSQAALQVNAVSSPSYGLRKRPGTTSVAKIGAETLNPKVHFVNRDNDEQYAVVASNGAIKVFDAQTGAEIPVATPDGLDYLKCGNPQTDLKMVSVADYTFIVNTQRPVQLNAGLASTKDSLEGVISFPIPLIQPPVIDPTDPTQNPSSPSNGTGGSSGLGLGGGGGIIPPDISSQWDPNRGWPTDDPFFTPGMSYGETSWGDATGGTGSSGSGSSGSGSGSGTGSGSGDTGSGSGGTGGTTTPPVTQTTQNPDGTWPTPTDPNTSYTGRTFDTPLPSSIGDGSLLTTMKAQGLSADAYLVTYQLPVACTVSTSSGDNLSRYFMGKTTASEMQTIVAATITALQGDGYSVETQFMRVMDNVSESFPKLVIDNPTSDIITVQSEVSNTRDAVWYLRNNVYDPLIVNGVVGFDATVVFLTVKNGVRDIQRLPVRISFPGSTALGDAPTDNAALNMACGKASAFYSGSFIYDKFTHGFDIPFHGFTNELHRYVEDYYSGLIGTPPMSYLRIESPGGFPYEYDAATHNYAIYPSHRFTYIPPLAYRIIPKALATQNNLGPFSRIYRLSGGGNTVLAVDASTLPA